MQMLAKVRLHSIAQQLANAERRQLAGLLCTFSSVIAVASVQLFAAHSYKIITESVVQRVREFEQRDIIT